MADDFQFNFRGFYPARGFRSPRMPEDTDPLLFNDPDSLLARDIRAYMDVAATGRQPETLRFLEDERKEHGMVNYLRGMDRSPAPAAQQVGNGFQLNSATQQPPPALPTGTPQQVADLQAEYAQNAKRIAAIKQEIAQLEKGALTDDQLDMALAANRAEIGDLGNSLLHQNRIATRKATAEARDWNAEQAELNRKATRDYTTSQRIKDLTAAIEDIDIELPRVENAESRDKLKAKRARMQKELDELNGTGFKFNFKGTGDFSDGSIETVNGQRWKMVRTPDGKIDAINLYGNVDNAKYLDSADGTAMTPATAETFKTQHTDNNGQWDSEDSRMFYTMNTQKNTPEGAKAAKEGANTPTIDETAEKVRVEKGKNEAAVNEAMKINLDNLNYRLNTATSDTLTIPQNGRNVTVHREGSKLFFEAGSGKSKVRKEYKPEG